MQRLAIDIDEVLMPFLSPMAKWKGLKLPKKDSYPYIYSDIFNISSEESKKMVYDFYQTSEFRNIKPIVGSQRRLKQMRSACQKIYAVTGRQDVVRRETTTWLETYFPDIFDDLVMTNSFTKQEVDKMTICKTLALDTIIDDNLITCLRCKDEGGIRAINFVSTKMYPWCVETEFTVKAWKDIK